MYPPYRRSDDGSWSFLWFYLILAIVAVTVQQGAAHAVPESRASKAAEDLGYTNIKVIDRATVFINFRGCSEDDAARFTVTGTNSNGEERTFYVCAGYFKGGTVRSK
jgi:hypothetical protein